MEKTCNEEKKIEGNFHNQVTERAAETAATTTTAFLRSSRVLSLSLPPSFSLHLCPATDLASLCSCRDLGNWKLGGKEQGARLGKKEEEKTPHRERHRTLFFSIASSHLFGNCSSLSREESSESTTLGWLPRWSRPSPPSSRRPLPRPLRALARPQRRCWRRYG